MGGAAEGAGSGIAERWETVLAIDYDKWACAMIVGGK